MSVAQGTAPKGIMQELESIRKRHGSREIVDFNSARRFHVIPFDSGPTKLTQHVSGESQKQHT